MSNLQATTSLTAQPSRKRWTLIVILLFTILIAYIDRVNVSVLVADHNFLSTMGIEGQPVQMGLLMTMFLFAYGLSNVLLGPVGDLLGPRKAMSISIFLWGLSMILGGMATTFMFMLATRVLLGLGEGMHWPMQSKFVKNWFPPQERAKANSWWVVGLLIGPAIAMPFFTWIVAIADWRTTFYVLAVVSLIPLALLLLLTTDHPHQNKGVNAAEREYIEEGLRAEAEREAEMAKSSLWENMKAFIFNYRFWLLTIYYFSHCSVWWGTMAWLPSYLKVARGFSWTAMGAWSSLPYIIAIIFAVSCGWLSDKAGRRAPFSVVAMLAAGSCIYGAAYVESNTAAAILISFGIGSICIGMSAAWALLQEIVPSKAVGAGAGMMNGVANGGSAFAPVLIGFCITVTGGSYVGGLMFLVGVALLGAVSVGILAVKGY